MPFSASICHATEFQNLDLAFYYGSNPPITELKLFKNIVFEPKSGVDPKKFENGDRKAFAYASLGEAINVHQYAKPIEASWVIAKNDAWNSVVLDQTNPAWQKFFIDEVITPLWNTGYRGFFLDTLDSYRLATNDPNEIKKQQQGLINTIRTIKSKYPEAKLIVNRGFEILPEIKSSVDGVVVESLFNGWNNKKKEYFAVSEVERKKLLALLSEVKKMGLPITIVDYVSPKDRAKAESIAKQISNLGFNPWVTNGDLTEIYLVNVEIMPRKILLFYQGELNNSDERIGSYASKSIAMPLNYLGYVTILRNINEPLPSAISKDEFAGIIMAMDGILLGREQELHDWYLEQFNKKIPIVVLNNFGINLDSSNGPSFGLSVPAFIYPAHSLKIISQSPLLNYEISPIAGLQDFMPLTLSDFTPISLNKGTSLLRVSDEVGNQSDIAAITPWGGYFLTLNFLVPTTGGNYKWSINPFKFFKEALRLPDMPIPDTTTENGRRLMFAHIDGDGFANKGEWYKGPFVGEVIQKDILERYSIPTTVSIIQGEIASNGIHPNLTADLEKIAKQIFALPYVEIASHTYSHPYNWQDAAKYKGSKPNPYSIPIPNYRFDLNTEIVGSVNYINTTLAPPEKKCKVFLWSGEGDVPEKALELTYQLGLRNLNPGLIISKYNNSMSRVSSLGLNKGPYYQVFAPIGNDYEAESHTERFFYSLIDVIDAFKLTENPQRLKPIDIYYHFFTAGQIGGVKALQEVYEWALAQPVMNIYASDYVDKVTDFNSLLIAKQSDGWVVKTNDNLRELRMPTTAGYPDLINSVNVVGYNTYNNEHYIHLGPGGDAVIRLTTSQPQVPFLVEANARISRFVRNKNQIDFSLEGYLPPKFTLANMQNCTLWDEKEAITSAIQKDGQQSYDIKQGSKNDFTIKCK